MRRREERLSSAFRNKGNGQWEGGLSRTSVGKVKVKSKKSSNSLLFPVLKKKSCFNFQSPLSGPSGFNFSILPIPDVLGLKASAISAACMKRSGVTLAHCPVRAAGACSGSSPLPRQTCDAERLAIASWSKCGRGAFCSGSTAGGRGATDFLELDPVVGMGRSAVAAGHAASSGFIADGRGETDFLELDPVVGMGRSAVAAGQAASSGSIADGRGETDLLKLDPVVGIDGNADAAGQAGSRFVSRMQSDLGLNSRIHGSQSSCFACARVSSGALLGACVVGSASAAVGSARLPASRTRTYADVAASACGGMAVMQRHACNSVVSGGFLPVQKSTSYNWGTGRQGPTGTTRVKGGVSGPAEDLRPVPEVVAGVNFRPAGGVRRQVVGSFSGQQPGTGTRTSKGSVVTPSLHPEVPDSLSVSPGPGKRIRQSMGWTKVCGTAQSGIWLLKGNARACMFPANLDHLRVGWKKQGSYKTAWVTPGQVCLCSYKYGHGAAVRPQTNKAIWDGVISLWGRVAPFLSPWCGKKELPTGVNLNHYDGSRSCVRWHSDNEPLFGPRDSPKLIVSLSLGNPVEFKVRRVSDSVTSSITLDHGDVLVMDGSAQSEYYTVRCLGCRDLGLTLLTVGLRNTLRPVHLQA